jgi:hypothetical protein
MTSRLAMLSFALVACGGGEGGEEPATNVTGQAVYRDAATDHAGAQAEPAAPPAQGAKLSLVIEGSGDIPELDPQCSLDPAGSFEAHYLGTLDLGDGSAYVSSFGSAAGEIVTPSGCEIPELTVGLVTDIRIRAELTANAANCESYCAASARANAEQECGATASSATCRAEAEATAQASCTTTCTTETHVIVAETSLAASLFGNLDAEMLQAAAFGELEVDLVFDHMEDQDGNVLEF